MSDNEAGPSIHDDLAERAEFFYTALSFLMSRSSDSLIPEVIYFMHPDQIITFMKTFGGRKITVPTISDFSTDLYCGLAAYYRIREELPWRMIQQRLDIDNAKMKIVKKRIQEWLDWLEREDIEIPPFIRGDAND